jgi:hypothetical protein
MKKTTKPKSTVKADQKTSEKPGNLNPKKSPYIKKQIINFIRK